MDSAASMRSASRIALSAGKGYRIELEKLTSPKRILDGRGALPRMSQTIGGGA